MTKPARHYITVEVCVEVDGTDRHKHNEYRLEPHAWDLDGTDLSSMIGGEICAQLSHMFDESCEWPKNISAWVSKLGHKVDGHDFAVLETCIDGGNATVYGATPGARSTTTIDTAVSRPSEDEGNNG